MHPSIIKMLRPLLISVLLTVCKSFYAQKVGVVLSGGGASGVAHIGVLKALEENNIPIDYITGTSMGALIGGLYASGYSPTEIEEIFLSEKFQQWAKGEIDTKYDYFLRKKEDDAGWVTFKFSLDSIWETNLPTNLISPVPIDFALMKLMAPAAAAANYNFDSLYIPFRCVAADLVSRKSVVFNEGDLPTLVRASMTYPFYIKPLKINGRLLFDGGIYNNFPSNVMYNDFMPDYIIGSNVSYNYPEPDEDNLLSQIKTILVHNTDYTLQCEAGTMIEPETDNVSVFDFSKNKELIANGYKNTLAKIDSIKSCFIAIANPEEREKKRTAFREKQPPLIFEKIYASGIDSAQSKYIIRSLRFKNENMSVNELEPYYMRLSSEDKIKQIYPQAFYNPITGFYKLKIDVKKEKDLFVSFGGNFSSRPINQGFVGLQYNYLGRVALTLNANSYFGKFYSSASAGVRLDFNFRIPMYLYSRFTLNKWDFFKSSNTFFEDVKPSFLVMGDTYFENELALPVGNKNKFSFGVTWADLKYNYYQTKQFLQTDTTDKTSFSGYSVFARFERNSLDRIQYPSIGSYLGIKLRFVEGQEYTLPGSTSVERKNYFWAHEWAIVKLKYEKYFIRKSPVRFGILAEMVYSNQPFFENYTATVLAASAFQPIPEAKTLFQEKFRAHAYGAFGIKNIFAFTSKFHLRLEGYVFQPYNEIWSNTLNKALYGPDISMRYFIASSALVYHTPLGPIALNLNYYDKFEDHWSLLFHFGFLIFNKSAFD
ncbi:MAG: hypothetical protein D8M18_04920 [Bacteroidetes bacterium]|nr:hypothetical protein [Bacteroidota bacterium]